MRKTGCTPWMRHCILFAGLICFMTLSVTLYWSEQSRLQIQNFLLDAVNAVQEWDTSESTDDVVVSDALTISYRPWEDDPECRDYTVSFIRNEARPMMALVSYPGSGNTWIRGVIERLTGHFTGSVYTAKNLFMSGFYGEAVPFDCGCTVVQKTHDFQNGIDDSTSFNNSAILIIRNPYQALVSYRNYLTTGNNQTASSNLTTFAGIEWTRFVYNEVKHWRDTALRWIPKIHRGGVLHYDDLMHDSQGQFRLLMNYLGLEVDENRLKCVLKHNFASFKRNATREKRNPYSNFLRIVVNGAIDKVQSAIDARGYNITLTKEASV